MLFQLQIFQLFCNIFKCAFELFILYLVFLPKFFYLKCIECIDCCNYCYLCRSFKHFLTEILILIMTFDFQNHLSLFPKKKIFGIGCLYSLDMKPNTNSTNQKWALFISFAIVPKFGSNTSMEKRKINACTYMKLCAFAY